MPKRCAIKNRHDTLKDLTQATGNPMDMPIKPIKPKKISDQAFDQIRELIYRGKLKPGDRVMAERELARAMQVSAAPSGMPSNALSPWVLWFTSRARGPL